MCLFGVVTFDLIFTFDFEAIIDFKLMAEDKFFYRMIARKAFCHTHPLGGVDVLFGGL